METAAVPCLLQCGRPCNPATDAIGSTERWESIRQKSSFWKGLDKFGSIHECVDWVKGPAGHFIWTFPVGQLDIPSCRHDTILERFPVHDRWTDAECP